MKEQLAVVDDQGTVLFCDKGVAAGETAKLFSDTVKALGGSLASWKEQTD